LQGNNPVLQAYKLYTDTGLASARWALIRKPSVGNGNGLIGHYYQRMNFDSLVFARIDPNINF
jgi:hypothetical protein